MYQRFNWHFFLSWRGSLRHSWNHGRDPYLVFLKKLILSFCRLFSIVTCSSALSNPDPSFKKGQKRNRIQSPSKIDLSNMMNFTLSFLLSVYKFILMERFGSVTILNGSPTRAKATKSNFNIESMIYKELGQKIIQ